MTRETARQISTRLLQWLGSGKGLAAGLVIFVMHAIWLALSAIYPLPFDEYYHFGIIKLYAAQWSPFIAQQPAEASLYGDITRYPSYLYHYVMSFPYRLLEQFIPSEEVIIVTLRLMNIALFVLGLLLFRKLFDRVGVSRRISHAALLFFAVTPIVPLLAAHINYDNALIVLTPLAFLLAYNILASKAVDSKNIVYLLLVGLFGCLMKETFLPIYGLIFLYVGIVLIWRHRQHLLRKLWHNFRKQSRTWQIIAVVALLLGLGLFTERYVQNQLVYGNYGPECDSVQSVETCSDYMPWYRNYQNKQNYPSDLLYGNPVSFTQHWVSKLMRGHYAIFSHTPTNVISESEPFGPIVLKGLLPLPIVLGSMMAIIGGVAVVLNFRRLWRHAFYRFALCIIIGYVAVVWTFNYTSYLDLGAAQAIQARYFLPLLPLMLVITLQTLAWLIRGKNMRMVLIVAVGCLYIYTGGIAGWLIRSDANWYWQHPTTIQINRRAQDLVRQIVIH